MALYCFECCMLLVNRRQEARYVLPFSEGIMGLEWGQVQNGDSRWVSMAKIEPRFQLRVASSDTQSHSPV